MTLAHLCLKDLRMQKRKGKQTHLTTPKKAVKCKISNLFLLTKYCLTFFVPTEPPDNNTQLFVYSQLDCLFWVVLRTVTMGRFF